jgi:hypothetical protein
MPGILQEKFQVDEPPNANDDAHSGWVSDASARTKKGLNAPRGTTPLPPGMDIDAQTRIDTRALPMTMGGESDVSADYNREAVQKGYQRKPMRSTDDEYTKAHQDAFYDEITVDGDTGFAERNNMLDRL